MTAARRGDGAEAGPAAVAAGGTTSAAIFTAKPTALVVDDDPVARQRLNLLLLNLGVQVRCCASVAEGLKALQEDIGEHGCVTFTRIFCDIVMPEASGDALLGLLTSSGWPCSIVMVTGNATEEERQKCEAMGATAVLSKPVRKSDLEAYFTAEATRDGRQMPGRPAVSLRHAAESSQLADALLVSSSDRSAFENCTRQVPSWTVARDTGKPRAVSAPRLRARTKSGGRAVESELDWTHTSAAVHALAMGAALALAVHVEAGERDAGQGPMGQAAEVRCAPYPSRARHLGTVRAHCARLCWAHRATCLPHLRAALCSHRTRSCSKSSAHPAKKHRARRPSASTAS